MSQSPWLIVGQGLAGSCLAFEFLRRDIPFRIIDRNTGSSSRIAAGLLNPITGKNFEPSWRIQEFHPSAVAFFQTIETTFSTKIWNPLPILRLASCEKEWLKICSKTSDPQIQKWIHPTQSPTPPHFHNSITLHGGGWFNLPRFLNTARHHFLKLGLLETSGLETFPPNAILCQGANGLINNQLGPHRCAKGEILTVSADWPETHIRIGSGGWLIPIGGNQFRIGSTYEWNQLDYKPTPEALQSISNIARNLGGPDFTIVDHLAAIRPILRRSQPLIGKTTTGNWFLNALGSKGSLYAPGMAQMLASWIINESVPHSDFIFHQDPP